MLTSDRFESSINQQRSRLFSPVFELEPANENDHDEACFEFKYNIYSSGIDGFLVGIENYANHAEKRTLLIKRRSGDENKWYLAQIKLPHVYALNRVIN